MQYGTPDAYGKRPLSRKPPSTRSMRPEGWAGCGQRKSPSGPNASACVSRSKWLATIHAWLEPSCRHQPVPGSPLAIAIIARR